MSRCDSNQTKVSVLRCIASHFSYQSPLIDFKKAFDSINHRYIQSVLTMYEFGPSILNWINQFFTNKEACILMKGNFSERILLRHGVPQGDIISPYIHTSC